MERGEIRPSQRGTWRISKKTSRKPQTNAVTYIKTFLFGKITGRDTTSTDHGKQRGLLTGGDQSLPDEKISISAPSPTNNQSTAIQASIN